MPDKPYSPSCDRNRDPILGVLRAHFIDRHRVLEIGSGTGQHAMYFGAAMPHLIWQTSDVIDHHAAIQAWIDDEKAVTNVRSPLALDVSGTWPDDRQYDAVFTANTLHIMSWESVQRLFSALPRVLQADALLVAYGPFNYHGEFTSPSNRDFQAWLKQRDARSGIRDFEAVTALAASAGLQLIEDYDMPANNRCLVWRNGTA